MNSFQLSRMARSAVSNFHCLRVFESRLQALGLFLLADVQEEFQQVNVVFGQIFFKAIDLIVARPHLLGRKILTRTTRTSS